MILTNEQFSYRSCNAINSPVAIVMITEQLHHWKESHTPAYNTLARHATRPRVTPAKDINDYCLANSLILNRYYSPAIDLFNTKVLSYN